MGTSFVIRAAFNSKAGQAGIQVAVAFARCDGFKIKKSPSLCWDDGYYLDTAAMHLSSMAIGVGSAVMPKVVRQGALTASGKCSAQTWL